MKKQILSILLTKPKSNCVELEGKFSSRKMIPQHLSVGKFTSASVSSLSQRKSWSEPPYFTASLTNCLWQLHSWEWQNAVPVPRFTPRGCEQQAKQHTLCKRLVKKSMCAVLSAASTSLPRHEGWLQCTWHLQQKSLRALIPPKAAFCSLLHSQCSMRPASAYPSRLTPQSPLLQLSYYT